MINAIINGIFTLIQGLLAVVLAPIDLLLANIPVLNEAANGVAQFTQTVANAMSWVWDFPFPLIKSALTGFVVAWVFFANSQRAVTTIKLTYNWLQKLKFW